MIMDNKPGRRRFITLMAAFAGLPLLPDRGVASVSPVVWRGQALGAPATLVLNHQNPAEAERLLRRVVVEVARLESIFSLFRPESALSELNRTGALAAPPSEMVELLELCRSFHGLGDGRFDPTIQPLWLLHARHFSRDGADPAGPSARDLRKALALVGFDKASFHANRLAPGPRRLAPVVVGATGNWFTAAISYSDTYLARDTASDKVGGLRSAMIATFNSLELMIGQLGHEGAGPHTLKNARELRGRMIHLLPVIDALDDALVALEGRAAAQFADQAPLGLRAGDALHLAIAFEAGLSIATLDRKLAEAGNALGVPTELL